MRSGKWKLHFPHEYITPDPAGGGGKPGNMAKREIELSLFDLEADPAETKDVAAAQPGRRSAADEARRGGAGRSGRLG